MSVFEKISPEQIENSVKLIGKDWMLITANDQKNGRTNVMTASWGTLGVLWNKNVCICFVRPERYTHELLMAENEFSIAFLDEKYRDALRFCGRESGRNIDKVEACGLNVEDIDGVCAISEAKLVLTCKKLYIDELKKSSFLDKTLLKNYENGGYHTVFICEITGAYKKGEL